MSALRSLLANRFELRGTATPPPNLRLADSPEGVDPEKECGTCKMFDKGLCWGYGNLPVDGEWLCDSWVLDPNWQEQDEEQDENEARYTLPAHRFLERKKQQKPSNLGPPYTWVLDVDDTITAAPQRYQRLVEAMKAVGDRVVILTGHGPRETREHLLEALGIEWDEIVIVDPGAYGEGKREALEGLNAFMLFDDRVEFGPEVIKACPVAFQYTEPPGDNNAKKDAKAAAKALNK